MGIKEIFDGTHQFELIANADGTTTLIHSEKFSGILRPFLRKMLVTDTPKGFNAMNQKLKERVEGQAN